MRPLLRLFLRRGGQAPSATPRRRSTPSARAAAFRGATRNFWARALLLALLACKDDKGTGGDGDDSADCPDVAQISGVEASLADAISMVVIVRWTTSVPATGHVEFGDGFALSTPPETEAATGHEAVLVGIPAETEAQFRVVLDGGDCDQTGEAGTITTGQLPAELGGLVAQGEGNDAWMYTPILGGTTAATLLSPEGEIVWYRFEESGLDTYRVRPTRDGTGIWYNAASVSGDPADDSAIVRVSLDGADETRVEVPLLAHDFVELPDGTLAAIVVEYRDFEGEDLRGDQIVEVAPDGTQTVVWSAWDCFDPATDWGDDSDFGWTFANALDYDEDADVYTLGIRNFSTIVQIDRATGACEWAFGDAGADFGPTSGSGTFIHQHQFQRTGGSLLVFDNDGAAGTVSRAIEYQFDPDAQIATEIWSYTADPTVYSFVLGDVHRFDDGDTLVTWSVGGQIDRVDADGERTWMLNTPIGLAFGFDTVAAGPYPD